MRNKKRQNYRKQNNKVAKEHKVNYRTAKITKRQNYRTAKDKMLNLAEQRNTKRRNIQNGERPLMAKNHIDTTYTNTKCPNVQKGDILNSE